MKCKNQCVVTRENSCCRECEKYESCADACDEKPETCGEAVYDESVDAFKAKTAPLLDKLGELLKQKAAIEQAEKDIREKLKAEMEQYRIKQFDFDAMKITYVAESQTQRVDSDKLKADGLYEKYTKASTTKAYVKIDTKGAKK